MLSREHIFDQVPSSYHSRFSTVTAAIQEVQILIDKAARFGQRDVGTQKIGRALSREKCSSRRMR